MTGGLAAAGADWATARRELATALARLSCVAARTVAEELVGERLGVLERAHPGDEWARRALAGEQVGLPPEYAGPGANSVAKAVEQLVDARAADGDACRARAAEAIAEAVMGALVAVWGVRHPAEWADWYAAAARAGGNRPPPLGLWDDAEVRVLAARQWRAVAARLTAPEPEG